MTKIFPSNQHSYFCFDLKEEEVYCNVCKRFLDYNDDRPYRNHTETAEHGENWELFRLARGQE